jgi:hypothetical protein
MLNNTPFALLLNIPTLLETVLPETATLPSNPKDNILLVGTPMFPKLALECKAPSPLNPSQSPSTPKTGNITLEVSSITAEPLLTTVLSLSDTLQPIGTLETLGEPDGE